ncbi:MAG: ChbG/HpnK family deacetylase [Actinobacteria bacterium]|nr:ChbG/HpnK family deacetylase [Actinomycetota bacterium]
MPSWVPRRAKTLGVTPTFLTSHDDVVARHLALFDVFLDVAEEYALPIRHGYNFGSTSLDATAIARRRGHFVVDHTVNWSPGTPLLQLLEGLPEGISEVIVHPALDSPDVAAVLGDAAARVTALNELLTLTPADIAEKLGITTLTWPQITTSSR